jgi:hypothetical protein
MQLVVTNDDGFDSPGIAALVDAARDFGEPIVIAPATAQSGVGHQLTVDVPIRVERAGKQRYRVDGTPADCARLALTELAPGADWLLAGINHGANLGADVYTSGTWRQRARRHCSATARWRCRSTSAASERSTGRSPPAAPRRYCGSSWRATSRLGTSGT